MPKVDKIKKNSKSNKLSSKKKYSNKNKSLRKKSSSKKKKNKKKIVMKGGKWSKDKNSLFNFGFQSGGWGHFKRDIY